MLIKWHMILHHGNLIRRGPHEMPYPSLPVNQLLESWLARNNNVNTTELDKAYHPAYRMGYLKYGMTDATAILGRNTENIPCATNLFSKFERTFYQM